MYYLACFYQSTGAYNHAETLLQNVCHMRDRILGSTHPHSAMARKKLVDCYIIKGSYANAESQIVDVFNVLQMKLGLKHPWTIETINCLIDLFEKMNEPVKIAHYKAMLPKEEEAPEKCPDR